LFSIKTTGKGCFVLERYLMASSRVAEDFPGSSSTRGSSRVSPFVTREVREVSVVAPSSPAEVAAEGVCSLSK
jgi:hypothetical protein